MVGWWRFLVLRQCWPTTGPALHARASKHASRASSGDYDRHNDDMQFTLWYHSTYEPCIALDSHLHQKHHTYKLNTRVVGACLMECGGMDRNLVTKPVLAQ